MIRWCLLVLLWAATAGAETRVGEMPDALPLGPAAVGGMLSAVLMAGCVADDALLELTPEQSGQLEQKRFATQKRVIQLLAERQIAQLDLERMLTRRTFNLTAVQKRVGEVSVAESRIRNAHVEFLYFLADLVTDDKWQLLMERVNRAVAERQLPGAGGDPLQAPCLLRVPDEAGAAPAR